MKHRIKIPEQFEIMPSRGNFVDLNGPFYKDVSNKTAKSTYGFMPNKDHCNIFNFLHGGMISTFLDSAMAQTVCDKHNYGLLTTEMSVKYIHLVPNNRWITATVDLGNVKDGHVTASAEMVCRNLICAKSEAVFKLLYSRPLKSKNLEAFTS